MARAAADWNESDRAQLVALLRRLADDAAASDGHPHLHHLPNVNPNANATPNLTKEAHERRPESRAAAGRRDRRRCWRRLALLAAATR